MESREEIRKRMNNMFKENNIIDKQELPKSTILPDLSDPSEYKRWFNMGPREAMVNLQKYVDLNKKDNISFEKEFNYLYTNGGITGWSKIPYKTFYNIISGKQRVDFNGNLTGNENS